MTRIKTPTEYEDTWDDLVKFGVVDEADEFENAEEFTDIIISAKRDPLATISTKFISKLAQTDKYKQQVLKTKSKRFEVVKERVIREVRRRDLEDIKEIEIPEEIRPEVQKEVEKKVRRVISKPEVTGKTLLKRERELKEAGIELSPEVKQELEQRKVEILGVSRVTTRELRSIIVQAQNIDDLEKARQMLEQNREVILDQPKGEIALASIEALIQAKQETL